MKIITKTQQFINTFFYIDVISKLLQLFNYTYKRKGQKLLLRNGIPRVNAGAFDFRFFLYYPIISVCVRNYIYE